MKKTTKSVLTAAIAGLMVGATSSCKSNDPMAEQNTMEKSGCNQKGGCQQKGTCSQKASCSEKK